MLKKLAAALNPFAIKRKPEPETSATEPAKPEHPHSFSCPCKPCNDETVRLTRARLKAQGA